MARSHLLESYKASKCPEGISVSTNIITGFSINLGKKLKNFISGFVSSSDLFSFINKLVVFQLVKKFLHGI